MSTKAKKRGGKAGRNGASAAAAAAANEAALSAAMFSEPAQTVEEALDEVEQLLEQSDTAAAERLLRSSALIGSLKPAEVGPAHSEMVPAMELLAQVLLGRGRSKEAFQWLRACCMLQPDGGAEKWMYYGQLIGGREALQAFKQGVQCMFKTRQTITEKQAAAAARDASNAFTMGEFETTAQLNQQMQALDKQISSGYTSMAELYVTDLCDDDGAEADCEKLLALALGSCATNPDALYALAQLRKIQEREPEACEVMTKLFESLAACRAASIENMSVLSLADNQEDENVPAAINMADVSYELRVAAAKLAYELNAFEPALGLLDQLLEEDDRILEVSHLAAVCSFHAGQPQAALEHIERCEAFLATEENAGMREDDEDAPEAQQQAMEQEEIDVTRSALAELKTMVIEAIKNAPPEADDDEENDEEAEEEDEDEDDMED